MRYTECNGNVKETEHHYHTGFTADEYASALAMEECFFSLKLQRKALDKATQYLKSTTLLNIW